jgi:tripartite-type tricarboxylate transporter receptor subunit TctC
MLRLIGLTLCCLGQLGLVEPVVGQSYPDRPVRIIVPSSAGGSIDLSARIVADGLSAKWQQPVVIENKPGAGMRIGAETAAKAPADGYTLFVAHDGTMAMNPVVYPDLRYDPRKDFEPVAELCGMPYAVMVHKNVKAKSLSELIAQAKEKPGALNHATGGTSTLLALELFKAMAGVDIASVSFRGAAPSITGLLGNQVDLAIVDVASAQPALNSEQVRPLAVTSLKRLPQYPDLPTMDEAGVKGYENETWMGMFAPKGTPPTILEKLRADVAAVLEQPNIRQRFEATQMRVRGGGSDVMRDTLERDIKKWATLVSERNIKISE